mmetsp:Transcript_42079/g.91688  ORF Transcript_42079/g.91688 Transcript_42079/m.91688 type:complete len:212 (+) Transcript_42079:150-785(+)
MRYLWLGGLRSKSCSTTVGARLTGGRPGSVWHAQPHLAAATTLPLLVPQGRTVRCSCGLRVDSRTPTTTSGMSGTPLTVGRRGILSPSRRSGADGGDRRWCFAMGSLCFLEVAGMSPLPSPSPCMGPRPGHTGSGLARSGCPRTWGPVGPTSVARRSPRGCRHHWWRICSRTPFTLSGASQNHPIRPEMTPMPALPAATCGPLAPGGAGSF